jgi:hypothetical protein
MESMLVLVLLVPARGTSEEDILWFLVASDKRRLAVIVAILYLITDSLPKTTHTIVQT